MKICIISESKNLTGASNAALGLARSLRDFPECEVSYIYSLPVEDVPDVRSGEHRYGRTQERLDFYIGSGKSRVLAGNFALRRNVHRMWQEDVRELRGLIHQLAPDVINLHNVGRILNHAHVINIASHIPIVWTMHDRFALSLFRNEYIDYHGDLYRTWEPFWELSPPPSKHLERFLTGEHDITLVSPSRWLERLARCELDHPVRGARQRIRHIPNGCPHPDSAYPDREASRRALGLDPERFTVLFVGSPDYRLKNYEVLARAVKLVAARPLQVMVVGTYDPHAGIQTKEQIEQHLLAPARREPGARDYAHPTHPLYSSSVHFYGGGYDQDAMKRFYAACDVLVSASCVENSPNVIVEAAYASKPAITTRSGGAAELIDEGETGWSFDYRDERELANLLERAAAEPGRVAQMGLAARSRALREHDPRQQAARYLAVFEEVRAAGPRRRTRPEAVEGTR